MAIIRKAFIAISAVLGWVLIKGLLWSSNDTALKTHLNLWSTDSRSQKLNPESSLDPFEDPAVTWPKYFWQLAPNHTFIDKWADKVSSWTTHNPDWQHIVLDDDQMNNFIQENFRDRPDILGFWDELKYPILQTDLFRYLALFAKGGVYSDMDTTNYVPINEWIPPSFRSRPVNVVAGLEYADTTYRIFPRNISFSQWTLMSTPGHRVYEEVVNRVISRLEYVARVQRVPISGIKLNREEILAATGPGVYSDAVLAAIRYQLADPSLNWDIFFGLKEPKLFGDILVLPINGFGSGQKHSNSSQPGWGEVLVKHHFGSSWFKKRPSRPPKAQTPSDGHEKDDAHLSGLASDPLGGQTEVAVISAEHGAVPLILGSEHMDHGTEMATTDPGPDRGQLAQDDEDGDAQFG